MMTLGQYQEREGLLDRIDDLESKLSALQSERDQLKEEATLYRNLYSKSVEACMWMHDDESLGLQLGSDITTKGVNALRKQRDQLKKDLEIQAGKIDNEMKSSDERRKSLIERMSNSTLNEIARMAPNKDEKDLIEIVWLEQDIHYQPIIDSLQSQLTTANKIIDQCEEALNRADRFIGKVGCGDDCLPKCIETALDAIQSLKLKGK